MAGSLSLLPISQILMEIGVPCFKVEDFHLPVLVYCILK